jgi:hypothetical protein
MQSTVSLTIIKHNYAKTFFDLYISRGKLRANMLQGRGHVNPQNALYLFLAAAYLAPDGT